MNLRKKSAIILAIIIFGLGAFYLALFKLIILNDLAKMEMDQAEKNIVRIESILNSNLKTMEKKSLDWSNWDDTYDYVKSGDPDYIETNLQENTFVDMGIDLFAILDTKERYKIVSQYNLSEKRSVKPSIKDRDSLVDAVAGLEENEGTTGFLNYQDRPIALSIQPILTTSGDGPSRGHLVMGRFVDQEYLNNISSIVLADSTISLTASHNDDASMSQALKELDSGTDIYTSAELDEENIIGLSFYRGINQNNLLLTEVKISRDLFSQAEQDMLYFNVFAMVAMLLCGWAMYHFVSRSIIGRITNLSNFMSVSNHEGTLGARITLEGSDEITELEESINGLIDQATKSKK